MAQLLVLDKAVHEGREEQDRAFGAVVGAGTAVEVAELVVEREGFVKIG